MKPRPCTIFYFLVCALFFPGSGRADDISYSDAHVKAAYILKLRNFVQWPTHVKPNNICVVGSDLIGVSLAQLQRSLPDSSDIQVIRKSLTSSFDECNIVFISESSADIMRQILFSTEGKPVLTISDIGSFVDRGGMIGFVTIDQKIKMELNVPNAERNGLVASSKILEIAYRVLK